MNEAFRKVVLTTIVGFALSFPSGVDSARAQALSAPPIRSLSVDPQLNAMLPEKIRAAGVLKLATDAHYPPCESFAEDGKTMIGWEPDMWTAMGQVLGVRVEAESIAFAGLIPGVVSGRYDTAMECITDTLERQKQVTFVDLMMARSGAITLETNTQTEDPHWFCGRRTGTQQGTIFAQMVNNIMTPHCTSAGKPAVENSIYPSADAGLLALYSGRVDFIVNNEMTVNDIKRRAPKPVKLVKIPQFPTNFTGMIVQKDNQMLANALLAAVKALHRAGVYDQVVEKWGLQSLVLKEPGLNLAVR